MIAGGMQAVDMLAGVAGMQQPKPWSVDSWCAVMVGVLSWWLGNDVWHQPSFISCVYLSKPWLDLTQALFT